MRPREGGLEKGCLMIRIGVIGAGGRGGLAKLAHRPEEGAELVAACDIRPEVLEQYKGQYGPSLKVTANWREVVADKSIDAVFITTPDYLHEEMAVGALEADKAVYLEKPMTITLDGCDRILKLAKQRKSRLYVGHNMRFFPVMEEMKRQVDSGVIGEVQAVWCRHFIDYGGDAYFKDWHSERANTTGLLLQKGAHDIDIIHWLAGGYTQRTVAMGKLSVYNRARDRRSADTRGNASFNQANWPPLSQRGFSPEIDVEDHTMMLMQLDNGVQASYEQCHYTPDAQRNYTVIGTQGRIENFGDYSSPGNVAEVYLWTHRCGGNLRGCQTIRVEPIEGSHGGADPRIVSDFLEYVRTGKRVGAQPLDARMSVAAGYLATKSLRNGSVPMDVPPAP